MAKQAVAEEEVAVKGAKQLAEEKKKLKEEQKQQRKEAKQRAKEISMQEEELDEGRGGFLTFFATVFIVAIWLAVIGVVIKLDIGGFGSNVLAPILKNVPVVNRILPSGAVVNIGGGEDGEVAETGFSNVQEALVYIKQLEAELERTQNTVNARNEDVTNLKAEVLRLQEFEQRQTEFALIQQEFYEEVIYSEKGPGMEGYIKYFKSMDPALAEYWYRQVVGQAEENKELLEYVKAYSKDNMKPKQAALILESLSETNMDMAASILKLMSPEDRGIILQNMDPSVAAKLTKIMNPGT